MPIHVFCPLISIFLIFMIVTFLCDHFYLRLYKNQSVTSVVYTRPALMTSDLTPQLFLERIGTISANLLARSFNGLKLAPASRLLLSRIGQTGSISALVLPSGSIAAKHRKDFTAERS
ncbi:hypothetical protein CSKR_108766 [Clonorchis sinensis]|uniref:Uncharacterized protein n=1 Tax=Clonorchis sinensis TaxID=79923 RepID=A0A3R7H5J7_CLOSI|nr:hypothetical protein CSKR_108766 [Clonorchis sinensis]